jgi:hypothetical protein
MSSADKAEPSMWRGSDGCWPIEVLKNHFLLIGSSAVGTGPLRQRGVGCGAAGHSEPTIPAETLRFQKPLELIHASD